MLQLMEFFFSSFIQISHAGHFENAFNSHGTARNRKIAFSCKIFFNGTTQKITKHEKNNKIKFKFSIFFILSLQSNPYGLKDSGPTSDMSWTAASLQPTTGYYSPYDPTLAAYG
jgi:hypothetical protein